MAAAVLALGCLIAGPAFAAEVPFDGPYPITRSDRIFPLSKIKPGQKGVGYTVFAGAEVEPFGVEVLGLLEGMLGPGQDVILARLTGEKIEHTGVISGMSGSPVYIDGLLVGAVSYRFGAFPKDPIAGITPIRGMLDVYGEEVGPKVASAAQPPDLAALARGRRTLPAALTVPAARYAKGPHDARPIATPIVLGGFAPAAAKDLIDRFEAAGHLAIAGSGGGQARSPRSPRSGRSGSGKGLAKNARGEAGRVAAAPIAPGAPIAALLMRGDMNIAGTGTVTLVEDGKVFGFGHPFFGYGHVVFPMATAAILHTLASQAGSYKQSQPALEVGAILHDRLTAIAGDFDTVAPMVPASIRVEQAGSKGAVTTMNVEIIDEDMWLPLLLDAAIGNAISSRLGAEAGGTMVVNTRIDVGERTLEIDDVFTAFAPMQVGSLISRDVSSMVRLLAGNGLERAKFESISVSVKHNPRVDIAWLDAIVPERLTVRGGDALRVIAHLRPYRQGRVSVPITVQIPKDVPPGKLELFVGGAIDVDERDAQVRGDRVPSDLDDLLGLLAERRYGTGLYARTYRETPGLRSGTEILPALPPSARLALSVEGNVLTKSIAQTFGPSASVAYPRVVVGGRSLNLRVTR